MGALDHSFSFPVGRDISFHSPFITGLVRLCPVFTFPFSLADMVSLCEHLESPEKVTEAFRGCCSLCCSRQVCTKNAHDDRLPPGLSGSPLPVFNYLSQRAESPRARPAHTCPSAVPVELSGLQWLSHCHF